MPNAGKKRFEFDIPSLGEDLQVIRFRAQESLSTLFQLELDIICENPSLAISDAIDQTACLELHGEYKDPRYLHGIVSRLAQGPSDHRFTTYHVTIVPGVWRLTQRSNCRIFQEKTLVDIITETLIDAGFVAGDDFKFITQETHPLHEYCVQYRETDMAFIARLMHEEGMWYYFTHEAGRHTLVISDTPTISNAVGGNDTIRYYSPGTAPSANAEHIQNFQYEENLRTGSAVLTDYDFKRPALNLESNNAEGKFTNLEAFDYPGAYIETAVGGDISRYRREEYQSLTKHANGQSDRVHLVAGGQFTLEDHPRSDLNQKYLITQVIHQGEQQNAREEGNVDGDATTYINRFMTIPATTPYRHPQQTPKPVVEGPQTAIVVGPAGEEIYVDEHGRVKVQFHWDRYGKNDEHSSCWIRVSQVWAGASWGAMYIPRIDHEVIVDFLEGDPDQPIITGRVYHGTNVPPYSLPANKTKSTLKSDSHKAGGSNEIRFEDEAGQEEVYRHAQKDENIVVENDRTDTVGHDETISIGNDRTETVGNDEVIDIMNDRTETVHNNETLTVTNNRTRTVNNNESVTVAMLRDHTVGINETISVGAAQQVTVGGMRTLSVGINQDTTYGVNHSVNVGNNESIDVGSNQSIQVGSNQSTQVGDDQTVRVGKKITIDAGDQILIKTGQAQILMKKDGTITMQGKDITIKGSGKIFYKAAKNMVLKAKKILEN